MSNFVLHRVGTDHNADNTTYMLRDWLVSVQKLYHYIEWRPKEEPRFVQWIIYCEVMTDKCPVNTLVMGDDVNC